LEVRAPVGYLALRPGGPAGILDGVTD